jgi:hypothetical protein
MTRLVQQAIREQNSHMPRLLFAYHLTAQLCFAALAHAQQQLPHSQVVIVGRFAAGPVNVPVTVSRSDALTPFDSGNAAAWPSEIQLRWFFRNGGTAAEVIRVSPDLPLAQALRGGFTPPALSGFGLTTVLSDLGILIAPELTELPAAERDAALSDLRPLAAARHFMLLLDPPAQSNSAGSINAWAAALPQDLSFSLLSFPRLLIPPENLPGGTGTTLLPIGGSGAIAAIMQRNDAATGLWKAPSSLVLDAAGLEVALTTTQADALNTAHINPIRFFAGTGHRLFGYRTRNTIEAERRFVSVQRLLQWTSHSLRRDMAPLAASAANNDTLWTALRQRGEDFCLSLFQAGAIQGSSPSEAYFVRCDATTTSAADIAAHRVKVLIGLATVRAAEFTIQQISLSTADPERPVPEIPLLMLQPAPGQFHFYYPAIPGFDYFFESTPTLATWTSGPVFPGDGSWQKHIHFTTGARQMFRVRVP